MELTYINENGASVLLKKTKPFFITRLNGVGTVRQTINGRVENLPNKHATRKRCSENKKERLPAKTAYNYPYCAP